MQMMERGDENIQENSLNTSLLINLTGPQANLCPGCFHAYV